VGAHQLAATIIQTLATFTKESRKTLQINTMAEEPALLKEEELQKIDSRLETALSLAFPSMDQDMPLHLLSEEVISTTSKAMLTEILTRPSTLPIREVERTLTFPTSDFHMITWHRNLEIIKIVMLMITRIMARS